MIETTVGELKPRDEFTTARRGGRTCVVSSVSTERADTHLRNVYAERHDGPVMITTPETKVWAVTMVRKVSVPCLALTHPGDKPVVVLHDLATGPKPRGVFCGECAASADEAAGF